MTSSRTYHNKHLRKHQKKFNDLILRYHAPFANPYDNLASFDISHPTFSGLFKHSAPVVKPSSNVITNAVFNLTDHPLEEEETKLLSLGLKFSPSIKKSTVAETSAGLEPILKKLDPAVESAATYDVTNCLMDTKRRKSNLSVAQQKALKSLKEKSQEVKILPADKGDSTVVMTNEQYNCRMEEHLGSETYSLLKKDPTESLARKLDVILKKLLKDKKISKQLHDDSRVLHPRPPQIYGLPKIHKPGNPLRPIVSFYGTPLSALHKQLSNILRPLTQSSLRLKNTEDFLDKFRQDIDPAYGYFCSLDIKSLYTSCNMHAAVDIIKEKIRSNTEILPANITPEGISSLLNFSLDNAYLEYNSLFFRQNIGGPMGSPLTVALAEIRVSYIEDLAIRNSTDPPSHYYHFVNDGFGHFRNRQHAESFLNHINSMAPDLEYTIEHPSADDSIPFLDILIHPDLSTSIYRKPTHTNLYTHYTSSATMASKESTVRTLTRRAFALCSPCHLQTELLHLESTFLSNGYPLRKIRNLMDQTLKRLKKTTQRPPSKSSDDHLVVSIPYDAGHSSALRKSLSKYNICTVFKSTNTLRSILTHTKTPTPAKQQKNVIYKIPCGDCDAFYIGQTCRPLTKRIKEYEACHRLNNLIDSATGNVKSAPAKHGRDLGHRIAWSSTSIIASCQHRSQLDLLEHAAISTLEPSMNVQHKGPRVNACWHPLLDTIATSFVSKPANLDIGT